MVISVKNSDGTGQGEVAADGESYSGNINQGDNDASYVIDNNSTYTGSFATGAGNHTILLDSGGVVEGTIQVGGYGTHSNTIEVFNNSADDLPPRQTQIGGSLNGGGGRDTIIVDGSGYAGSDEYAISIGAADGIGGIDAGAGDDSITIANGVHIAKDVQLQSGNDTLSVGPDVLIDGSVLSGGEPVGGTADEVTIQEGAIVNGSVILADSDDTLTISGHVGNGSTYDQIASGEGEDTVTITSTAVVDVARINIGSTHGSSLVLEAGSHVTFTPGGYAGASISSSHANDYFFLGGTIESSYSGNYLTGPDITANYGADTIEIGKEFSAIKENSNPFLIDGGGGSDDNDTLDLKALAGRIVSHEIDPKNSESGKVILDDGTIIEYRDIENVTIPCFTAGTMIETASGTLAVEDLRSGDLVMTADNGPQPIRWIGSRKLSAIHLKKTPNLRPIRIRAGVLGKNTPTSELVVSPQHRVLVRSKIAQRMFGTDEVLVAAKQLLAIDGIELAEDMTEVEYWHFMFDRHEVVLANGARTESLYTGPEALKSIGKEALKEIYQIFPRLRDDDGFKPEAARRLVKGALGRKLATRHLKNAVALVN